MNSTDQKAATVLENIIRTGTFETKSYIGNKFRAQFKRGTPEGDAYYNLTSRSDSQAFRMKWAQGELVKLEEKRTHKQGWSRVDRTRGRYRPFGKLVVDFGGWTSPEAVRGAMTAAQKCCMMGEPWVRVHPQSQLTEYLVLELEFQEDFVQSWETFKSYQTGGAQKVVGAEQVKGQTKSVGPTHQ